MDPAQRERVHDDLKGIVKGELLFDDVSRALYSTDASLFEIEPLGVVAPRDEDDLRALVRYAGENQATLTARGAGAGLAGESLTAGIVLDFSRHFRSILDETADAVRVQPGVVHRDLARRLAASGRRIAPEPAHGECTLGGMTAGDASGPRAFRHGSMRDHVRALRVVLDDGSAWTAGRVSRWPPAEGEHGRLQDVVSSVVTLLEQNAEAIRDGRPRTRFNRCGYLLHDLLDAEQFDLARLLVGSEGTLGLFTEIELRTLPLPAGRSAVLLAFTSLDAALRAAQAVLPTGPAACELMDRRLLRLAHGDAAVAALVPAAEAVLLVEYEADGPAEARRLALDLADRFRHSERPLLALTASKPEEIDRFWQVREAGLSGLAALRGTEQPVVGVEDAAVPAELLPEYLRRVQEVLQRREASAAYLIHAGTGQVDMRPFLDLRRREDGAKLWALADEIYDIVLELGGTISSRNGVGLARSPWVSRQCGRLYPVFRELKALFDPRRLFNPGKIVGPGTGSLIWPLRKVASGEWRVASEEGKDAVAEEAVAPATDASLLATRHSPLATLQLRWRPDEVAQESNSCNGCGRCRTTEPTLRMCPIFRAAPDEAATPRAKANLMRRLLQPDADPARLSSDEVRAVADLCVNCKMCAVECPAHVNVPAPHAGGQGRQHRSPRSRSLRLGHGPHGAVRPRRQRLRPGRQRPPVQPHRPLDAGENVRRVEPPPAAGLRPAQLPPPRPQPRLDAPAARRPAARRLFRRCLRQL